MSKERPEIIAQFNRALREETKRDIKIPTVESIAAKIGISKRILYSWIQYDPQFRRELERLKGVQENDPFKTGDELDVMVDGSMIALLLIETKNRKNLIN